MFPVPGPEGGTWTQPGPGSRDDVAEAANVLAGLGLVTGPGVIEVPLGASWLPPGAPAEAWAHLALYRARPGAAAAGEALLLRGNGALTLGATPGIAVARMWLLAAACDVFLAARAAAAGNPVTPLSAEEISSWRAVGDELLPRLWQHLRRHGPRGASPAAGGG